MLGAIAGDIIGSVYEYIQIKTTHFPLFQKNSSFTDDTVMTIAVAYSIMEKVAYATSMKLFGRRYPDAGYGASFCQWIFEEGVRPYNSWGNGSAMRVSPIGFAFNDIETVLEEAKLSAEVSHNHPEGIKGAQATALAVFLARQSESKERIRDEITRRFNYDLNRRIDDIRKTYKYDITCQGTVPEAIISFLESDSFEQTIRNAISLGGDSDTVACIAGGIAHAYYKTIPKEIETRIFALLPDEFLNIINRFNRQYGL